MTAPGTTDGGVGPTEAARYLYGAAIVLVLLYAPDGLTGITRRVRTRLRPAAPAPAPATRPSASAVRTKEPTP